MGNQPCHPIITDDIQNAINHLDLIYINDSQLDITRVKKDNVFSYLKAHTTINDKKTIRRIKKLVIPPAWENVKIASICNGHIQAVGRDKNGKKQYRYHDKWMKLRNQTKFNKMIAFGQALPVIRQQVEDDLSQIKLNKTKVLALVIKLLEQTHIRIGNAQYAKNNQTYGLSTLRSKHVDIYKNKLKFEFTGKRGKQHSITLRNKRLIKLVNQCEEIPGWELFKYFDDAGNKHTIDSAMVNEYLQNISKSNFTAKDFRTWSATLICYETLKNLPPTDCEKQKDKNILQGLEAARKALGNTRSVVKKYYVHPQIISGYKDNLLTEEKPIETIKCTYLSEQEQCLLNRLSKNNGLNTPAH